MNSEEYKYDFIKTAIENIANINIVTDFELNESKDETCYIEISDEMIENNIGEGRVYSGSGRFAAIIYLRHNVDKKSGYSAELRTLAGNKVDAIFGALKNISYPLQFTDTVNKFEMTIYGVASFDNQTLINETQKYNLLNLEFEFELCYLR